MIGGYVASTVVLSGCYGMLENNDTGRIYFIETLKQASRFACAMAAWEK